MVLALKSSGSSNGIPYTEGEKKLAQQAVTAALRLAEIEIEHPLSNSDCDDLAAELVGTNDGVDRLSRAIFRGLIRKQCGSGKQFIGNDEFPKERDPTSVQLLMRGAGQACGLPKDLLDQAFPKYGGKKASA